MFLGVRDQVGGPGEQPPILPQLNAPTLSLALEILPIVHFFRISHPMRRRRLYQA
jgi:hypothetical protein